MKHVENIFSVNNFKLYVTDKVFLEIIVLRLSERYPPKR